MSHRYVCSSGHTMVFDRLRAGALLTLLLIGASACAHDDPRRFALRAPVTRDQDLDPVTITCKGKPESCSPAEYESSFAWDAADNSLFRPPADLFAMTRTATAPNVNALDEVPDSGWFTNRMGKAAMTPQAVADGFCKPGAMLDPDGEDGSWLIDHGKDNGANPGFRVKSNGVKYMMKTDEAQGERATAATAIAARFYYAAGWWAPCDAVVYFRRSLLELKPGLTIKANTGPAKVFDEALLTQILEKTSKRGKTFRAAASRWLPGKSLGPFTYEGRRSDDPNDVIRHEDRRDLRGARVLSAWLNHFDSREQNTMDTWESPDPKVPATGTTRHWYIDMGDCFGSEWSVDGFSRRHGYTYILDFRYILEDFATFGIPKRPWDDRTTRTPGAEIFGYFTHKHFDPDGWKGEYPNPAFQNMQEGDAAWATRIIARFERSHVEAAVGAGDLTDPVHTKFVLDTLLARQHTILKRYFSRLSPVSDVTVEGDNLCAVDLARKTETFAASSFRYAAGVVRGPRSGSAIERPVVTTLDAGRVCLPLPARAPDGGTSDDDRSRYVVVRLTNDSTPGPLMVHLYDLGPKRGLQVVGIERPQS
jgi:hypothetical protein